MRDGQQRLPCLRSRVSDSVRRLAAASRPQRAGRVRQAVCHDGSVRRITTVAVLTAGLLFTTASGSSARHLAAALNLRAVTWSAVTLPPVCGGSQPIRLHRLGSPLGAIGYVTPIPKRWSSADFYGRHSLQVWTGWDQVLYGDLAGDAGQVAALDFSCTNGGGTADGELLNGFVVFSGEGDKLSAVGVVTPQAQHPPSDPVSTVEITIAPGKITAHEFWSLYDPTEIGRWATTVWTYAHGRLSPGRPVVSTRPPPGWKP
jgi:hypothetical protein